MEFSVVVPVHNDTPTLVAAVRSALGQHLVRDVVVVDDGSTDDPAPVVSDLADRRVSLVRQEQAGSGAARNAGARMALGTHVIFLDADDVLLPEAGRVLASVPGTPSLVRAGHVRLDPDGTETVVLAEPDDRPFPRGSPLAGTFAMERELFFEIGGYDVALRFGENTDLLMRAHVWAERTHRTEGFASEPTVRYEAPSESAWRDYRPAQLEAIEYAFEHRRDALEADAGTRHDYHAIASRLYRLQGDRRMSLRHALAAARARPASWRAWALAGRAPFAPRAVGDGPDPSPPAQPW